MICWLALDPKPKIKRQPKGPRPGYTFKRIKEPIVTVEPLPYESVA